MNARGKARIITSTVIGLFPIGAYGLTYLVPSEVVGKGILLFLLGLVLGAFAYTCPAWYD